MPCCGQSRRHAASRSHTRSQPSSKTSNGATPARTRPPLNQHTKGPTRPEVPMQYLGQTSLVVIGPLTGRRYRFVEAQAIVSVDHRDAAVLNRLSQLALANDTARTERKR